MSAALLKPLCDELAVRLQDLISLQGRLHETLQLKLEAMRRAHVEGMLATTRLERDLVQEVSRTDDARRDVVARMCAALNMTGMNRAISLRVLASRLDTASRERLLKLADALRQKMLAVGESNRVSEMVCREMMVHFKSLFAAMVQDESEPRTYQAGGDVGRSSGSRVLDAVG
ncbi:MAG: flagellar export chaperone FlgN [Planctomycetota bacterium]